MNDKLRIRVWNEGVQLKLAQHAVGVIHQHFYAAGYINIGFVQVLKQLRLILVQSSGRQLVQHFK